jgi:hypothetical protein
MPDSPRWIEPTTAVLLACAGPLSGWAAYQSALSGGIQASHYASAYAQLTEASRLSIIDGQQTAHDRAVFTAWLEAAADGDTKRMKFYER